MVLVALTFDDGYLEHIDIARLLAKLGIRATFFVITHLRYFEGKPLLTQREDLLAELVELGHEVGSHTCTHRVLINLDKIELERELRDSKRYLEDITGREILGLAYPYGIYNINVIRITSKYYYYARATDILPFDDPLNINVYSRYTVGSAGIRSFHRVIFGLLDRRIRSMTRPSIFVHKIDTLRLIVLTLLLKYLGAKFVTMSELVEHIAYKLG